MDPLVRSMNLITEIVLDTQTQMSVNQCSALLERIAHTPTLYDAEHGVSHRLSRWAERGGRGWLGT